MDKKIEKAMDDIAMIKFVIEKTQRDFSGLAAYFIWIGIINLIAWLLEQGAYLFRNIMGYGNGMTMLFGWIGRCVCLLGYALLFTIYYRKAKNTRNEISMGMIKIWGIVLIGSKFLVFLYISLIPSGNSDKLMTLWRCRELIEVLPVIFALFMTGILTKRMVVTIATALYSIFFFILFVSMKEIAYGAWGGAGTLVSASSICIKCLMIFGMFALGIFLRMGAKGYGNKCDTRSISDET